MKTTAICVVNGATIQVSNDDQQLVPIKPICEALGVNYTTQVEKLQNHPILSKSIIPLRGTVAADGKVREMTCLPMEYVFGWIFTINPNNVNETARESLIRYQEECNHALYEYFTRGMRKEKELLEAENKLLKERDEIIKAIADCKEDINRLKAQQTDVDTKLLAIRAERHNPQPSLFD